jgi:protein-tyrosine phosphatase
MEKKILMVCLGNICRSPIAEGVMQAAFKKYKIAGKVDSAGVLSYHAGEAPDKRAIRTAQSKMIDIGAQVARQIKKSDFDEYDFIFTMDQSVHDSILEMVTSETHKNKIFMFMEYAGYPMGSEVPDPYYSGTEAFENVFLLVEDACEKIIKKWNDKK